MIDNLEKSRDASRKMRKRCFPSFAAKTNAQLIIKPVTKSVAEAVVTHGARRMSKHGCKTVTKPHAEVPVTRGARQSETNSDIVSDSLDNHGIVF